MNRSDWILGGGILIQYKSTAWATWQTMVSVIERKIRRGLYRHTSCIALHFMVSHRCYVFYTLEARPSTSTLTLLVWSGTEPAVSPKRAVYV